MSGSPRGAELLSKVPPITLAFWVVKILATTVGETGGDALSMTLELGYAISSLIFLAFFCVTATAQISSRRYHPVFYWAVVVATTTVGTTTSDYLDRTLGLGYVKSSLLLFGAVVAVLLVWHRATGTIAADRITTRKNEVFYWITILVSNTLGTALGDFVATSVGLGFERGALVFGGLIALVAAIHLLVARVPGALLFWAAYVLTRPLGATLGDLLTKPHAEGGLAFGRFTSTTVLAAAMILIVSTTSLGKRARADRAGVGAGRRFSGASALRRLQPEHQGAPMERARLPTLLLVAGITLAGSACNGSDSATTSGSGGTSGGSGGGTVPLSPPVLDAGTSSAYGTQCPAGMSRCGDADYCCPSGDTCLANPSNKYGCGAGFCCFSGCPSNNVCGAGCCAIGQVCKSGGSCGLPLCCGDQPDPICPSDTAATCPSGTTCVNNHSARACGGDFACYAPSGAVGCPGEITCPNGADFCPAGTECQGISGVCPMGSEGGNYCCKPVAGIGQSCDNATCQKGSSCVPNNQCSGSDPAATNVCYGPCGGGYPVDCGNYCCPSDLPICTGGCYCSQ